MEFIGEKEKIFAVKHWAILRPLFCRLAPELVWDVTRNNILEEINEEIEAKNSGDYEYSTFFTYPTDEQMEKAHVGGNFFSEIRELVGYRAAEALSTLTAYIRLEKEGATLNVFKDIFNSLWNKFSEYSYNRGFRTSEVRSNLVLMLSSNNTFELIEDRSWQEAMLTYFTTDNHPWSQEPLAKIYPEVIKVLGGDIMMSNRINPIVKGSIDVDGIFGGDINSLIASIIWEQGEPEDDPFLPPVMSSTERRGNSQPPSDIYYIPFHQVKFNSEKLFTLAHSEKQKKRSEINNIALHFFTLLHLRTNLIKTIGIMRPFKMADVTNKCNVTEFIAFSIIGQLIKVGIVEFDKYSGLDWNDINQEYIINAAGNALT